MTNEKINRTEAMMMASLTLMKPAVKLIHEKDITKQALMKTFDSMTEEFAEEIVSSTLAEIAAAEQKARRTWEIYKKNGLSVEDAIRDSNNAYKNKTGRDFEKDFEVIKHLMDEVSK